MTPNIKVVVVVEGGVVQDVYSSNLHTDIEVIDLDVSSFPEDIELEEIEDRVKEVKELRSKLYRIY